jgi:hypothetical protein
MVVGVCFIHRPKYVSKPISGSPNDEIHMDVKMPNAIINLMIRQSGRSWWQCRYSDGKVLSEWDTLTGKIRLPVGSNGSSRWELAPKKGIVGLKLLCPNGVAGELEGSYPYFQLKAGYLDVGPGGSGRSCAAHVIGAITNIERGDCTCYAWDYGLGQLLRFSDNFFNFQYMKLGRLSLEAQGITV